MRRRGKGKWRGRGNKDGGEMEREREREGAKGEEGRDEYDTDSSSAIMDVSPILRISASVGSTV